MYNGTNMASSFSYDMELFKAGPLCDPSLSGKFQIHDHPYKQWRNQTIHIGSAAKIFLKVLSGNLPK